MSVLLVDELLGLRMSFAGLRALLDMGVPRDFALELAGEGDLSVAQVDLHRGGTFEFGGPDRRLILAVRRGGELVDLAALSSTCEDEWALRLGVADFLGEDWLLDAVLAERREVRLFSTPMGWLRGGGRGVCVLDWSASALGALRGLGTGVTLVCDPGAKPKLQAMLTHGGLPLVAENRPDFRRVA